MTVKLTQTYWLIAEDWQTLIDCKFMRLKVSKVLDIYSCIRSVLIGFTIDCVDYWLGGQNSNIADSRQQNTNSNSITSISYNSFCSRIASNSNTDIMGSTFSFTSSHPFVTFGQWGQRTVMNEIGVPEGHSVK